MLPGAVLCAVCLLLPAGGSAIPTPPLLPALASSRIDKATSELNRGDLQRTKRSLDLGDILKTIGVGVDVGGPQLGFNAPNVTLDTPIGTIGSLGINCRNRRDDGNGRRGEAEPLETDGGERRGMAINFAF